MKHRMMWFACVLLLLPIAACEQDTPLSPPVAQQDPMPLLVDAEQVAHAIMEITGWPAADEEGNPIEMKAGEAGPADKCGLILVSRDVLPGNLAHYEFRLRIGFGEHDVIGLHRVVKERRPWQPVRTQRTLFMLHGDCGNFESTYLPGACSGNFAADFGLAAYLAREDVDVWGLDQAYTLVPSATTDFGFMADWGLQRLAEELRVALAISQVTRTLGGNGRKPLNLLGFCGGVSVGYTALNMEAQMPPGRRLIRGYIQVEMSFSSLDEGWVQANCVWAAYCRGKLDQGIYQEDWFMPLMADLARTDPDGDSPIIPGFTNFQAALYAGGGPFWFAESHNHAAVWNDELPVDFQFVTIDQFLDINAVSAPYQPLKYKYEVCMIDCGADDLPFDDHVHLIDVPVLYVGAAGGFGPYCDHILTRIASDDIQRLDIALLPSGQAMLDYGHNDLFAGSNAEAIAWQPMLAWVVDHTPHGHH